MIIIPFLITLLAMIFLYARILIKIKGIQCKSDINIANGPNNSISTLFQRMANFACKTFGCRKMSKENNCNATSESNNELCRRNKSVIATISTATIVSHKHFSRTNTNTKTLTTTLLILGTYLLCYIPGIIFFGLTCVNGCPFPLSKMEVKRRVMYAFITNALTILKAIIDPFIYAFRTDQMKSAIRKLICSNGKF